MEEHSQMVNIQSKVYGMIRPRCWIPEIYGNNDDPLDREQSLIFPMTSSINLGTEIVQRLHVIVGLIISQRIKQLIGAYNTEIKHNVF